MNRIILFFLIALASTRLSLADGVIELIGDACHYSSNNVSYKVILDEVPKETLLLRTLVTDSQNNRLIDHIKKVEIGQIEYSGILHIPESAKSGLYFVSVTTVAGQSDLLISTRIPIINLSTFSNLFNSSLPQFSEVVENKKEERTKKEVNPLRIIGTIHDFEGEKKANAIVIRQTRGGSATFDYTLSDSNGRFIFESYFYGSNQLQISARNPNYAVSIEQFNYPKIEDKRVNWRPYALPENITKDRSLLSKLLIDYNYNERSPNNVQHNKTLIFEKKIDVKNYIKLNSTLETVRELIPFKRLKEKGNQYKFFLMNTANNTFFKQEPLIMIDGFTINAIEEVLSIELPDLESFQVSYNPRTNSGRLGRLGRYGVLNVVTKNKNYVPKNGFHLKFEGIQR